MSSKRILNISSEKKSDVMQQWSDDGSTGLTKGPARIIAGTGTVVQAIWCATARPAEDSEGTKGSAIDKCVRTNTTCYMRGLKERIELRTNSGTSWQWRRITFSVKGEAINLGLFDPGTSPVARQTSEGMIRLFISDSTVIDRTTDLVFKGTNGTDWSNHFIAPTDQRRVTVHSDITRVIKSGNDSGTVMMMKRWYPMNKNLYYQDEESGDETNTGMFSQNSKGGMGDYYVYDLFYPNGGTSADELSVDCEARLYWHEK